MTKVADESISIWLFIVLRKNLVSLKIFYSIPIDILRFRAKTMPRNKQKRQSMYRVKKEL